MIISLFSVQINQILICFKIPLYFLIKNNFFICDWCYVKKKKENNKKQKGKENFVWTQVLGIIL